MRRHSPEKDRLRVGRSRLKWRGAPDLRGSPELFLEVPTFGPDKSGIHGLGDPLSRPSEGWAPANSADRNYMILDMSSGSLQRSADASRANARFPDADRW